MRRLIQKRRIAEQKRLIFAEVRSWREEEHHSDIYLPELQEPGGK